MLSLGLSLASFVNLGRYSAEALALFARFTTPPSEARKAIINSLVVSLTSAGIWSGRDLLHIIAAASAQAGQRNWMADQYNLVPVNLPTFVADRGYTGDGTSSYLNTAFTPSTQSTKATQNDASAFVWSRTSVQDLGALLGDSSATPALNLYSRYSDDTTYARLNTTTDGDEPSADGSGLWCLNRTAAGAFEIWRNGVLVSTETAVSTSLSTAALTLLRGASTDTDLSTSQVAAFGFGKSLTPAQQPQLYTAIAAYMAAVGA